VSIPDVGLRPVIWRGKGLKPPNTGLRVLRGADGCGPTVTTNESRAGIFIPCAELRTDSCKKKSKRCQAAASIGRLGAMFKWITCASC
jgi:hypothetical protein